MNIGSVCVMPDGVERANGRQKGERSGHVLSFPQNLFPKDAK
jgi:hypothetical protein